MRLVHEDARFVHYREVVAQIAASCYDCIFTSEDAAPPWFAMKDGLNAFFSTCVWLTQPPLYVANTGTAAQTDFRLGGNQTLPGWKKIQRVL